MKNTKIKITYCKADPMLNPKNRKEYIIPTSKCNYQYPKDFADYHTQKVHSVYLNGEQIDYVQSTRGQGVVSNFPAQHELLEMNADMKLYAQYHTGFKPIMK